MKLFRPIKENFHESQILASLTKINSLSLFFQFMNFYRSDTETDSRITHSSHIDVKNDQALVWKY